MQRVHVHFSKFLPRVHLLVNRLTMWFVYRLCLNLGLYSVIALRKLSIFCCRIHQNLDTKDFFFAIPKFELMTLLGNTTAFWMFLRNNWCSSYEILFRKCDIKLSFWFICVWPWRWSIGGKGKREEKRFLYFLFSLTRYE